MNTAAIAQHLNITKSAIVRIEEWANVLFVVCRRIGARFVSKKVVEAVMNLVRINTALESVVIDVETATGYIVRSATMGMSSYFVKRFVATGIDVRYLDFSHCTEARFINVLPESDEFQKVIEAHITYASARLEAFGEKCLYPIGYKLEQLPERRIKKNTQPVTVASINKAVPSDSIPKTLEEARLMAKSRFHSWNEDARQLVQEILSAQREVCITSHVDPIGLKVQKLGNDLDDTRIKPAIAKIAVALGGKVANYDPN